jgi:hypothetical protein
VCNLFLIRPRTRELGIVSMVRLDIVLASNVCFTLPSDPPPCILARYMQGYGMPAALFPRGRRGLPLYEYVLVHTRLYSGHLFASSPKMYTVVLDESKSWTTKPLAFGKLYPVQSSYISIYRGSGMLPSDLYLIVEQ